MFTVTRFCVQPFVSRGGQLQADEAQQFRNEAEALGVAGRLQRRVAGVAVFSVTGEPVQGLWREPKMVAAYGDVPAIDL